MNFLVDAQLPPGLVRWLADRDHAADHVTSALSADANDTEIWDYALEKHAIVITKDEDFAKRATRSVHAPVIVWLRIGNATNRNLRNWLETRWESIAQLLKEGNRLIEVR